MGLCLPRFSLRFFAALFFPFAAFGANLDFQASIDKRELTLDDEVTVTIQITGENIKDNLPFPEAEENPDFRLLNKNNYQSSSQNISIVNGRMTRTVVKTFTFQFTFKPQKSGELRVPGFNFTYQDFHRAISPTPVMVRKESPESNDISLLLRFSKTSLYLNEQATLIATIRKKAGSNVNQISRPDVEKELKKFFWIKPTTDKIPGRVETLGGIQYEVYDIPFIIFPILEGRVKIPSIPLQYTVVERRTQRRRDPFFEDPFFSGFFDNVTTQTKTKYSQPAVLDVKPLPLQGRPAGFDGAVGDFTLIAALDRNETKTGDAVNLKVAVTGRGNEKSFNSLDFKGRERFEVFDPEIQSSADIRGGQVLVNKTFKYVLIPQVEGRQAVGPVTLYFFNPGRGAYDSATAAPELMVQKGKAVAATGRYLTKEEVRLVGRDIRFIKTDPPSVRDESRRFYRSNLYVLLLFLPFAYSGLLFFYRRHRERLLTDPEYARTRKARKEASRLLLQARQQISGPNAAAFHATIYRSLSGFVADKLNLPSGGLTPPDLEAALRKRLPQKEDLTNQLLDLLSGCEMHRFANIACTDEERKKSYEAAETLMVKLSKEL